jgi:hypothetical protein
VGLAAIDGRLLELARGAVAQRAKQRG